MKLLFRLGAVLALLGVGLGALGAHALESRLTESGHIEIWRTAVIYHLVHAVALVSLAGSGRITGAQGWCFVAGIVCFSGSLYALSFGLASSFLGPVTPVGGLFLMVAWLWVGVRGPLSTRNS